MALEIKTIKVLVVEDEDIGDTLVKVLQHKSRGVMEILRARSTEQAIALGEKGDIAYCTVDLQLPEREGRQVTGESDNRWGFDVIRALSRTNKDIVFSIVSNYAEREVAPELEKLRGEGATIRHVIDKGLDSDALKYLYDEIGHPEGLTEALKSAGTRVVHLKEYRLARRLWRKAAPVQDGWTNVPKLTLLGPSQMGKDHWARTFARFRWLQLGNDARVESFVEDDLGTIGGSDSGLSPHVRLFGARLLNFAGGNSAGILARATAYKDRNPLWPAEGDWLPNGCDQPDFKLSRTVILEEIGNLPTDLQPLLLGVTHKGGGRISPQGVAHGPVQIGCPIVFTTNAQLTVVESAKAGDREFREDFYLRLTTQPDGVLVVPSFADMGIGAFFAHVDGALRDAGATGIEWASSARGPVVEAFANDPTAFRMITVSKIVDAYLDRPGGRILWDHVQNAITLPTGASRRVPAASSKARVFDMAQFENEHIVKADSLKHATLQSIVEASNRGESVTIATLAERPPTRNPRTVTTEVSKLSTAIKAKHVLGCELECKGGRVRLLWSGGAKP